MKYNEMIVQEPVFPQYLLNSAGFFVFSNHEKSATPYHMLINIGKTKMNVRNFPKQMMKALK